MLASHHLLSSRPCHSRVQQRTLMCKPAASAVATLPQTQHDNIESASQGNWAIIKVHGVNQFVEVGRALAVKSTQMSEATLGQLVRFKEVLAFKDQEGSLLQKGKPFLQDVIVEGIVEDQFLGPASASGSGPVPLPLSKVVITKIELDDNSSLN